MISSLALLATLSAPFSGWAEDARVPLPPAGAVVVHYAPCPEFPEEAGCAWPEQDGQPVHVFVLPSRDRSEDRRTFWHELGHAYDWTVLSDVQRAKLTLLMGMRGPWSKRPMEDQPAEAFGEAYRFCAMGADRSRRAFRREDASVEYGYAVTFRRQRGICRMLRSS